MLPLDLLPLLHNSTAYSRATRGFHPGALADAAWRRMAADFDWADKYGAAMLALCPALTIPRPGQVLTNRGEAVSLIAGRLVMFGVGTAGVAAPDLSQWEGALIQTNGLIVDITLRDGEPVAVTPYGECYSREGRVDIRSVFKLGYFAGGEAGAAVIERSVYLFEKDVWTCVRQGPLSVDQFGVQGETLMLSVNAYVEFLQRRGGSIKLLARTIDSQLCNNGTLALIAYHDELTSVVTATGEVLRRIVTGVYSVPGAMFVAGGFYVVGAISDRGAVSFITLVNGGKTARLFMDGLPPRDVGDTMSTLSYLGDELVMLRRGDARPSRAYIMQHSIALSSPHARRKV